MWTKVLGHAMPLKSPLVFRPILGTPDVLDHLSMNSFIFLFIEKDVMFYVAEMIPKLKTRTQKSGGSDSGAQQGEGGKKGKKKKK